LRKNVKIKIYIFYCWRTWTHWPWKERGIAY